MDWGTIGMIGSIAIGGYWYYKDSKKKKEKAFQVKTVQDLLSAKQVYQNGLVQNHNNTFAIVLEVQSINSHMKSQSEKNGLWLNFRGAINTLPCPVTLLVQSQYLDLNDYIQDYINTSQNTPLTPQLLQSAMEVAEHLKGYSERKTRDYRAYIIARFNPYSFGVEGGLATGNVDIDKLLSVIKGNKSKMSEEEARELAENMLDEVGDTIYASFDSMGIGISRLDRVGVYNMLYMTMNRDLSLYQRLHDVNAAGSFSEFKQSLTPEISLQQQAYYGKEDVS